MAGMYTTGEGSSWSAPYRPPQQAGTYYGPGNPRTPYPVTGSNTTVNQFGQTLGGTQQYGPNKAVTTVQDPYALVGGIAGYNQNRSNLQNQVAQAALAGLQRSPASYLADQAAAAYNQAFIDGGRPGGVGGFGGIQYPQISPVMPPSTTAAQNAAFGLAKAKAGQLGQSAMDTLRSQLAERGLLGSGEEAKGLVSTLAAATNPLSEENVAELQQNIGLQQHALDLGAQQAAQQYAGAITQRGQNLQAQQAAAQQALQREALQRQQQAQMLQTALSGIGGLVY